MPKFKKGNPGRRKGAKNKTSGAAAQAVLDALDKLGGVDWLLKLAEKDPKAYCSLLGRILPKDMNIKHAGEIGFTKRLLELEKASSECKPT